MMTAPRSTTPVRRALQATSPLLSQVRDGLEAVKRKDRSYLAQDVRRAFADSLDLDAALQEKHPEENRWDYLLGHAPSEEVIGVEPHSAKQDEISTVIAKKKAAKAQLAEHLQSRKRVARWLWVASCKVHFADTEKARRLLDQNGIEFVGRRVLARHLT
jgi:hypothetical protein